MAMNVNQDYSQFYVGTEQLKSYGSNPAAKKDTLMKYRFNTTDEHGNKVMDKMSKEETMKAVNEISSQFYFRQREGHIQCAGGAGTDVRRTRQLCGYGGLAESE